MKKYILSLLLFVFLLLVLSSCARILNPTSRWYKENDLVKNTTRNVLHLYNYSYNKSALAYAGKKIVFEKNNKNELSAAVNDNLSLHFPSRSINSEIYWIVDNEVFAIETDYLDYHHHTSIEEDKSEILTADSSKVAVVTGYTERKYDISNLSYSLPSLLLEKLSNAKSVIVQYYAGAEMIQIKLSRKQVKRLKKIFQS